MMNITENERQAYKSQSDKAKFATPEEELKYRESVCRECSKCNVVKPSTQFKTNTSGSDHFDKDGYRLLRPECIDCANKISIGKTKAKQAAKRIGIPYKAPPGTSCAICNKPPNSRQPLVFDHCHETDTFRGYLHNSCNRSIGVFGDDIQGLLNVLNYLNSKKKNIFIQDENSGELQIKLEYDA